MSMMPPKFAFAVGVSTDDSTGEILSVYLNIRKGKADEVVELEEGMAYANYDKHGYLLGIELLEPCSVNVLNKIARKEPAATRNRVKKFLTGSAPREMVLF
jgi:hypothetical protein